MSLEAVLEIFWRGMSVGMGIFELRVLGDDSLQSWRFGVAFGVNIPPIYCNVINRKKIAFDKERGHRQRRTPTQRRREPTPFLYLYYKVIYIIQGLPLSSCPCPLSFVPFVQILQTFQAVFVQKVENQFLPLTKGGRGAIISSVGHAPTYNHKIQGVER